MPEQQPVMPLATGAAKAYDCVVAVLNRGLADDAIKIARAAGSGGATIIHGRGTGGHDVKFLSFEVQKEKEIVIWLIDTRLSRAISETLYTQLDLGGEGGGKVFVVPAYAMGLDAAGVLTRPEAEAAEASNAES